ncbi:MAG: hypothetical protein JST86_03525 [Bacteroidetes bacterium]|nr:hypothetical protein [Bacteroidota bacterium]
MNFFSNTLAWIEGELFEASLILSFGIITLVSGFLFWKTGTTLNSKALFWPFIIIGLVYAAIGSTMLVSNKKRIAAYPQSYEKNNSAFIQAEKKRVEDFQYGYTISKIVASICFSLTLLIFWYAKDPAWQGIGIGLSYFALAGLVVDYFSQERAAIYYKAILETLN